MVKLWNLYDAAMTGIHLRSLDYEAVRDEFGPRRDSKNDPVCDAFFAAPFVSRMRMGSQPKGITKSHQGQFAY